MSQIRTILAARDFSASATRAAGRAALPAHEHGAHLRLLHVLPAQAVSEFREIFRSHVYTEQHLLAEARRRLDALGEEPPSDREFPEHA